MSENKRLSKLKGSKYNPFIIGLDAENRDCLYNRINARVDRMVEDGLIEEAKNYYGKYSGKTSVQAIGYKELKPYLDGDARLDECLEQLKLSTRHYAKRQLTWFRKDTRVHFLMIDKYKSPDSLTEAAVSLIKEGDMFEP
jgi:tRNA dimethylallyltransferase